MCEVFRRAIKTLKPPTAAEMARRLNETPQTVNNWLRRRVPADRVLDVVAACDSAVLETELRPDVFVKSQTDQSAA